MTPQVFTAIVVVVCLTLGFSVSALGADKNELQERIKELKENLSLAKQALDKAEKAEAEARKFSPSMAVVGSRLRELSPAQVTTSEEEQRQNAARALQKLQEDQILYRNRQLDQLLLDQLRQQ